MNRRDFMGLGLGTVVASAAGQAVLVAAEGDPTATPAGGAVQPVQHPRDTKLCVKPVMTNIIHSGPWQGPCRPTSPPREVEQAQAQRRFDDWAKRLRAKGLGRAEDVQLLDPVHITFSENWVLTPDQIAKLTADSQKADVFFLIPSGSSRSAYEIGNLFGRPIVLDGLNCRNVDIAAFTLAKGNEAFVSGYDIDLPKLLSLLRARKVFRQTKVLYPTDGVPPFTVGAPWDFEDLRKRHGVTVKHIKYGEMSDEMNRLLGDREASQRAERDAAELLRKADRSFLDKPFVVRSMVYDQCIRQLMARHGCNAFTIDCFEFCPSKLPQQWMVVPCLQHALFGNEGIASSCEADLGILLALRMLMSVSNKSCHQGNTFPRPDGTFAINHSAPSMKMNGFDQPDLPYQLGRFVEQGWGTKVVVDFMNNQEKTATVARVDPTARRLLVLRAPLVGSNGWDKDLLMCSVEAVFKLPVGQADEFLRKRLIYGNHLPWVYGDYTRELKALGEMLGMTVEVFA